MLRVVSFAPVVLEYFNTTDTKDTTHGIRLFFLAYKLVTMHISITRSKAPKHQKQNTTHERASVVFVPKSPIRFFSR